MSSPDPILYDFKERISSLWDFGLQFIWFKLSNLDYQILSSCLGYSCDNISDIIKFTKLSHQPGRVAPEKWGVLLGLYTEQCRFYNKISNEKEIWIRFTSIVSQEETRNIRVVGRKRNLSFPNLTQDEIVSQKRETNWLQSIPYDSFQIDAQTAFLEKLITSGISQTCVLSTISFDCLKQIKIDFLNSENKLLLELLIDDNPIKSIDVYEHSAGNQKHLNIFNSWSATQQAEVVTSYLNKKDEDGIIPDHFTFTANNKKKTHFFRIKASEAKEDFKTVEDSIINNNQWKLFYKRMPKELFKLLLTVLGGTLYNGILLCAKMLVQIDPKSMKEGLKDFGMNVCKRLDPAATLSIQESAGLTATKRIKLCSILKYHLGFYLFSNEKECSKIKNEHENIYTYKNYDYCQDINSSIVTRLTYFEASIYQIVINHLKTLRDSHSTAENKNVPGRILRNNRLCLPLQIGGDGGGGEMKMVVCPSFRKDDGQTFSYNAGGYEGKEDYDLMLNTLCPLLNETINQLNDSIFVFVEWEANWDFVVVPKILFNNFNDHLTLPNCFQFAIVGEKLVLSWGDNFDQSKVFDKFFGNNYIFAAWMPPLIIHGGDTKYFFMMQGRDGYSGKMCYLCNKSDLNWQTNQSGIGNLWTHESMNLIVDNNNREQRLKEQVGSRVWGNEDEDALYLQLLGILSSDTMSEKDTVIAHILKIKSDREGTGFKSLKGILQSIPMCHWICPVLHIKLGICTRLLNFLYDWIFEHLEFLTPEMVNLNLEVNILFQEYDNLLREQTAAEIELKEFKEGWNEIGKTITFVRGKIIIEKNLKRQTNEVTQSINNLTNQLYSILFDNELISETQLEIIGEDLSQRIISLADKGRIILKEKENEMVDLFNLIKEDVILKNDEYLKKCAERKELREKSTNKPLQHEFDKLLNRFSVVRQQYHTSSLIGKHCERLTSDSDEIMADVTILLKTSINRRDNLPDYIDSLIDDVIEKMTELLKCFDCICHFICRTSIISTDADIEDVRKLCNYFDDKWREYEIGHKPPKLHTLKDHVADQLDLFGNLGDFSEEHVERSHHIRNIFARIFANITNWEMQNKTIQSRVSQYNTPQVKISTNAALELAKRRFNSPDGLSVLSRKKNQKAIERGLKIDKFINSI